jgi:hypothetical protein
MLFGNGLACAAACAARWNDTVAFVLNPDFFNAALEFVGGCLIWLHTVRAWKDEEIKGVSGWPFIFFWTWGIYNLWYYTHIGQPISGAVAFMPALANSAFLFSYWVFVGPVNLDRRRDRARLWVMFKIKKVVVFFDQALDVMEEVADLPPRPKAPLPTRTTAALASYYCPTCCFTQHHDLDGHCMVCDKLNKGD